MVWVQWCVTRGLGVLFFVRLCLHVFQVMVQVTEKSESKITLRSSKEGSRYRFKFNNLNPLFFMSKFSVQNTIKSRVQSEGPPLNPLGLRVLTREMGHPGSRYSRHSVNVVIN